MAPNKLILMSLSCEGWYRARIIGYESGLEEYECVSWKVCIMLSNMDVGRM